MILPDAGLRELLPEHKLATTYIGISQTDTLHIGLVHLHQRGYAVSKQLGRLQCQYRKTRSNDSRIEFINMTVSIASVQVAGSGVSSTALCV